MIAERILPMTHEQTVRVAREWDDLASLADAWAAVPAGYIDAERDYFAAVGSNRDEVLRPHVVTVDVDGVPAALGVGWLERSRLRSRFGYRTVHRPLVSMLRIAHGGMCGVDDAVLAEALVRELDTVLASGAADVMLVPAVRLGSALDHALIEVAGRRRMQAPAEPSVHRILELRGTYDDFLARRDARSRYNLKRSCATLERELGERLEVAVLREPHELDQVFADLETVAARTYQRGLGAGFADTADRRAYVQLALARREFRAWVMRIDGRPVAFWQGVAKGRTFYLCNAGYDPAAPQRGIGTFVQLQMFRDLCADPAIDVVDFGWGDADYKARFGTDSWLEHDVLVFAPTLRARRLRAVRGAVRSLDRRARRLAARAGIVATVKRAWRRRLRGRTG